MVPWLCSRSQPGIKVIIRDIRGHLLHTVTFLVSTVIDLNGKHLSFSATEGSALLSLDCPIKEQVLCKGINSL